MKKLTALAVCACIALSAAFGQTMTRQQALDEIARIERFNAQVEQMLRQAWEAGRTQRETVIDTPYGKVTIKFNLAEIIRERDIGKDHDWKLQNLHGEMARHLNELRINSGSWRNSTPEGMKVTITHELGHHMDRSGSKVLDLWGGLNSAEDISEINADAFALRHLDKPDYILGLQSNFLAGKGYVEAVIKRTLEMEREERENLNRLRGIAGLSPQNQPQTFGTAQSYFNSGKAAYDRKEYNKAIACFFLAIVLDPNNAGAYYYRAEAWVGRQDSFGTRGADVARAVADFTEAVRLDPNNNTYKEALGKARDSQSASSYYSSGRNAYSNGDYDKAIADFTEVIRIDPNFINQAQNIYSWRGDVYKRKGDYDKAIADYTEAIQRYPQSYYYEDRAEAYMAKKDYIKAIADYTELVMRNNETKYYVKRAGAYSAYMAQKDYDKAIADFTELIRLKPNYADYYSYRAEAYIGKKDYNKAIADYTEAIRLSQYRKSDKITALSDRAGAYIAKRDYDNAIADCTEALLLNPDDASAAIAYANRAQANFAKRKYKEARVDVDKALRLVPYDRKAKDLDAKLKKKRQ